MAAQNDFRAKMLSMAKPAKLLRKTRLVQEDRGDDPKWWTRLPVHTLTFENPGGPGSPAMECRAGAVTKPHGAFFAASVDQVNVTSQVPHRRGRRGQGGRAEREAQELLDVAPGRRRVRNHVQVLPEWPLQLALPRVQACRRRRGADAAARSRRRVRASTSGARRYLHSLAIGDEIQCFPKGAKKRNAGARVGLVAFGVGITEALPVAAAELEKREAETVKLVWASKTWADTFWHDEIERLLAARGDRFEVTYILSREDRDGCRRGRVDSKVLAEEFAFPGDVAGFRFLSVGTKQMMKEFDAMIQSLGYEYPAHKLFVK